jgi:uncharacterized membrane-anchored protein YitT (DUF2179 family)
MMTQVPRPEDPPPAALVHRVNSDRSPWNWLLLIPIVLPLLTFIYNRWLPKLGGFPFFFWFQIMFTLLAAAVTAIVFTATKRRR